MPIGNTNRIARVRIDEKIGHTCTYLPNLQPLVHFPSHHTGSAVSRNLKPMFVSAHSTTNFHENSSGRKRSTTTTIPSPVSLSKMRRGRTPTHFLGTAKSAVPSLCTCHIAQSTRSATQVDIAPLYLAAQLPPKARPAVSAARTVFLRS